ncbi:MAG: hypothetical protein EAX96_06340 [Candidatus Lokiarchaeota archaeon]|nr:hypothetical protein [Candidatus Lokiarchaeota archaeon]
MIQFNNRPLKQRVLLSKKLGEEAKTLLKKRPEGPFYLDEATYSILEWASTAVQVMYDIPELYFLHDFENIDYKQRYKMVQRLIKWMEKNIQFREFSPAIDNIINFSYYAWFSLTFINDELSAIERSF